MHAKSYQVVREKKTMSITDAQYKVESPVLKER